MITKMNKLSILIYHKEYEAFLEKLRELGVVHVEIRQTGEVDERVLTLMQRHAAYKTLAKEMEMSAGDQEPAATSGKVGIEQVVEAYHMRQNELQELNRRHASVEKDIAQMETWGEFDWKVIEKLKENGWLVQFFCCQERSFEEGWIEEFQATVISRKAGLCYFITINPEPAELGAEVVRLPAYSLSELHEMRLSLRKEIEEKTRDLSRYAATHLSVVRSAIAGLESDIDLLRVTLGGEKLAEGSLVMLEGWVPEENDAEVRAMLDHSGVYYEERAAGKEDDAPIKLRNNKVTRFFEYFTKMYGMPDYGEFDPTPLLAPFYALFFGLCLGDAGYGVFLVLFGFYLKSKVGKSMKGLMNLLITLGVAAVVVGALLGTFFGVELVKLDLPEGLKACMISGKFGDTVYDKSMILALVVGMFHLCFAMLVKAICSTARYGFLNSLSPWGWFLFVGGSVAVATLNYLGLIDMEVSYGAFIGIGAVSAIGIYLLNNIRRNVFMNIGVGLWDTYNMATGLMGDLLSYLRLYALGLAGGMLGGVFNSLGMQMQESLSDVLWGIPGWICFGLIFVFGHSLNIALSCLSAYVHSIRLTFVEYFKNSGYDGRGTLYKPFSVERDK